MGAQLAAGYSVCAANLIKDGGFETPVITGGGGQYYTTGQTVGGVWLVEHADTELGIYANSPYVFYPAPEGNQICYLADNVTHATLRQDIASPLQAGVTYALSFQQSCFNASDGYADGKVTVEFSPAGGAVELSQTFSLFGHADWTRQSLIFTPSLTGPYTLRFDSTVGYAGNIDDIQLVAVPEPVTCGLVAGLGLLGLAGWRRRREGSAGTGAVRH